MSGELHEWELSKTDPDYDAKRRAMKQREQNRPPAIAYRNKAKRSGLLSFEFNDDCTEVRVWNYRKLRGAERVLFDLICTGKSSLYKSQSDGLVAVFPLSKQAAKAAREAMKLADVPESCARCEGNGWITNPDPAPVAPPSWDPSDPTVAQRYREWEQSGAAMQRKTWHHHLPCPICRGTGRAVQLESEEG